MKRMMKESIKMMRKYCLTCLKRVRSCVRLIDGRKSWARELNAPDNRRLKIIRGFHMKKMLENNIYHCPFRVHEVSRWKTRISSNLSSDFEQSPSRYRFFFDSEWIWTVPNYPEIWLQREKISSTKGNRISMMSYWNSSTKQWPYSWTSQTQNSQSKNRSRINSEVEVRRISTTLFEKYLRFEKPSHMR
jgi:hypothetical protein